MRLDKLLSDLGMGTRSEVKRYIRKGFAAVDGVKVSDPGFQADPDGQKIFYLGKEVCYQKYAYYMLYKPCGCVTARSDGIHKTVMDYIREERKGLSPAGRLDLDTEGLLLITNDGHLSHELLSPAKHVKKVYEARLDGPVTDLDVTAVREGVEIGDDTPAKPAELSVSEEDASFVRVTVTEGRYHQVKRMFAAVGKQVLFLKRIQMGSLALDPSLLPGEYRSLTQREIDELKKIEPKRKMRYNTEI